MRTKYFKRFAITTELVSIEELRPIAEMQARMSELVRYSPIQYLTDGYSFSMEEFGDIEIPFSDITWGEGVNAEHSFLHMKDGRILALPFGTHRLESLFGNSKKIALYANQSLCIPLYPINGKNQQKIVYIKKSTILH